jgi:peptidoglycan/LPS O-acetylase OafA/YrhL
MQTKRIYGFDAIRAASVLLVIASHVGLTEGSQSTLLTKLFSVFNASFGVRSFFVLSGFLISTLLIEEYERSGTVHIRAFIIRRALRILPLYFIVLLSLWPYFEAGRFWQPLHTAAYAVFFVYNFIPTELNVHYLSHLWSLGVEEQFYILWPVLFGFLAASRRWLVVICLAIVIVCAIRMNVGYGEATINYYPNRWTVPAIYPIALGATLAMLISDKDWGTQIRTYVAFPVAALVACILVCLPLLYLGSAVVEVLGTLGIAIMVGWIYTNQERSIVRALEWLPLRYTGAISYGLYMWQGVFTGNGPERQLLSFPPDPLVGAAITFPVAVISYHCFEQPILRLRGRILRRVGPAE